MEKKNNRSRNAFIQALRNRYQIWAVCSAFFFYAWLFPQPLFEDCIRVVKKSGRETETVNGRALSRDDYVKLFDIKEDKFKIVWKFFPK